jgi:predicted HicB family RNase H-like nuclease
MLAMGEKQQFNVYLSPELIRRVKHASVDSRQSLSAFVAAALETALDALDARPTEES